MLEPFSRVGLCAWCFIVPSWTIICPEFVLHSNFLLHFTTQLLAISLGIKKVGCLTGREKLRAWAEAAVAPAPPTPGFGEQCADMLWGRQEGSVHFRVNAVLGRTVAKLV